MPYPSLRVLIVCWLLLLAGCDSKAPAIPDAGPPPVDQCNNPSDLAITRPDAGGLDGGMYSETGAAVRACGLGECFDIVLAEGELQPCMETCLVGTVHENLSDGCLGCYIETFECGREHCVVQCLGAGSPDCDPCLLEHCWPRFFECSGLEPL